MVKGCDYMQPFDLFKHFLRKTSIPYASDGRTLSNVQSKENIQSLLITRRAK